MNYKLGRSRTGYWSIDFQIHSSSSDRMPSPVIRRAVWFLRGCGNWCGNTLCWCRTAAWPLFWPVAQC